MTLISIEVPGGSHQRDTDKSYDFAMNAVGKYKLCKCPIHYNSGKGTDVDLVKFRRHADGSQGMCFEGKTLIDSYSHQLKRLQLLIAAKPESLNSIFNHIPTRFTPLVEKIKKVATTSINKKYSGTDK